MCTQEPAFGLPRHACIGGQPTRDTLQQLDTAGPQEADAELGQPAAPDPGSSAADGAGQPSQSEYDLDKLIAIAMEGTGKGYTRCERCQGRTATRRRQCAVCGAHRTAAEGKPSRPYLPQGEAARPPGGYWGTWSPGVGLMMGSLASPPVGFARWWSTRPRCPDPTPGGVGWGAVAAALEQPSGYDLRPLQPILPPRVQALGEQPRWLWSVGDRYLAQISHAGNQEAAHAGQLASGMAPSEPWRAMAVHPQASAQEPGPAAWAENLASPPKPRVQQGTRSGKGPGGLTPPRRPAHSTTDGCITERSAAALAPQPSHSEAADSQRARRGLGAQASRRARLSRHSDSEPSACAPSRPQEVDAHQPTAKRARTGRR